jgi:hypothetical protein
MGPGVFPVDGATKYIIRWNGMCALVLLSIFCCLTIYNISLRGLSKSARRHACALGRAWRCFRYRDIDMRTEHEFILLRLPRTMVSTIIFPSEKTQ